ncbi:hypothetical protein AWZ03_014834 [Drosophila navojoa]|uniref:Uncharacterized protein n=1 Tax=Drosophila navojoa TaxID=7232 RepID=A0A484AQI6_DRONA|nr:hypothetical protein AWZ03_014834 [Drosophila navojoa]
MTLLVMPTMLDHLILGMDSLCAIDTTLYCGNVALTMRMKDELNGEASLRGGPDISKESDRSGGPQSLARSRAREQERKRGPEAPCWSTTQKVGAASVGEGLAVDEQGTSRSGEPPAQSIKRGRKKQQEEYVKCPQLARTKDLGKGPEERPPEVKLVGLEAEDVGEIRSSQSPRSPIGQEEDEENTESSPDDTGWPEDLEDELKEFLVAELAVFEGMDGVSNIAIA